MAEEQAGAVRRVEVRVPARDAADPAAVAAAVAAAAGGAVGEFRVVRRNLDARRRPVQAVLTVEVVPPGSAFPPEFTLDGALPPVPDGAPEVVVVGMGPAGLFAALTLVRHGIRPILVERGAPVRERRRDLVRITREHRVDPDSNYCFGEGGAGTYSDGKLYTRSHKRGDLRAALEDLVRFGASPEILVEAHPHIGTNKLPGIITALREALEGAGAVCRFRTRLVGIDRAEGRITAVRLVSTALPEAPEERLPTPAVVLATGHSARDVFRMLHTSGLAVEAKPFALGVRIEHPQAVIDRIQYHGESGDYLPPAAYSLVCQTEGRGVHSFCMCPGGIIAPCATSPGEIVTNGWSPSKRNNPFANSGMVVQLDADVWEAAGFTGPLAALDYQASVERACHDAAARHSGRAPGQTAPAQRLTDFLARRPSRDLPPHSYLPGAVPLNLHDVLPAAIARPLAAGLAEFARRMPGFLHPDAVLLAPESRTSSPVRIPRDPASLAHPDAAGLYPTGEGAGYAGGILSAALDGVRVAKALALQLHRTEA